MPTAGGPNTFGEENLVFGYDLGDIDNSFKGKPATNYLTRITQQYSDYDLTYFKITNGSHVVDVPQLGRRTVKYVNVWNDYNNGSGNCCLSLFTFGTGIDNVSGNTTYTYQIIYKTDTGYSHPNYMYRYEYGASGYIREGGLHSTGRRTHLGDGWYHAWGTVTLHPDTTYINTYLFHYEYATKNRVQVAAVMFTEGTEIIPPSQFLEVEETRSATQGLIDLTGNYSLDLSNVSFDSNAQMTFDGTDDVLPIGSSQNFRSQSPFTFEIWTYVTSLDAGGCMFMYQQNNGTYGGFEFWSNASGAIILNSNPTTNLVSTAAGVFTTNSWKHIVCTVDGSTASIYVDGVFDASNATGYPDNVNGIIEIGDWASPGYRVNGEIPVTKIYNRALTASEIKANYNAIKGRFNI